MRDFLRFRRMLTPLLIEIIFWAGTIMCIITGLKNMLTPGGIVLGISILISGPIALRLISEIIIVLFRIHQALETMSRQHTADGD